MLKKGDQLNHPFQRLLRQVENPTKLLPHIIVSRNAVINTRIYLLFLFKFEDARLKRCTHTREPLLVKYGKAKIMQGLRFYFKK